jgi:hypothetical protein
MQVDDASTSSILSKSLKRGLLRQTHMLLHCTAQPSVDSLIDRKEKTPRAVNTYLSTRKHRRPLAQPPQISPPMLLRPIRLLLTVNNSRVGRGGPRHGTVRARSRGGGRVAKVSVVLGPDQLALKSDLLVEAPRGGGDKTQVRWRGVQWPSAKLGMSLHAHVERMICRASCLRPADDDTAVHRKKETDLESRRLASFPPSHPCP